MHRCLLVPEIFQNILNSHQKPNGAEYELERILTAHNLLAVTLSCKWFAEPALDLIWKHVPDLRYLLKCLPAGLWEETVDNDHKTFRLTRFLDSSNWERVDFYSRRIRSLRTIGCVGLGESSYDIDMSVLEVLSVSCEALNRPALLLQNLRQIHWTRIGAEDNHLLFANCFLSLQINTVQLSLVQFGQDTRYVAVAGAFDAIAAKCPNTQSLCITGCRTSRLCGKLSALLRQMHNLHVVNLSGSSLNHQGFSHLGSLPHLRELHVTIYDDAHQAEGLDNVTEHPFRCLSEFYLEVPYLMHAAKIIDTFVSTPLRKVKIQVTYISVSSELEQFFVALTKHCISSQILEIVVSDEHEDSELGLADIDPCDALELHHIQPLFELSNLESLSLRAQLDPCHIDNAAVDAMVKAWPKLRYLDLSTCYGGRWPSKVDIDGLIIFAACHQLSALGLVINASTVTDGITLEPPGNGISCNTLHSLILGQSPIQHPKPVAAVLSNIFPNLAQIDAWDWFDEESAEEQVQHNLWQQCLEFRTCFVAIRNQESRRR